MAESGIHSEHFSDENGNPSGGTTYGRGFAIGWQNGPLGRGDERKEPNGAFVEDIIKAAADRIRHYQDGCFYNAYNARAIEHLELALDLLNRRTSDRESRGVEGTHQQ